jgi:hypothetical protein
MRTKISWNDEKDGRGSIAAGSTMCATLAEFADVNDGDGSIFDRIVEQPKKAAMATGSIFIALIRTRSPERCTVPSTIPSTLRSRAISGSDLVVCLYCIEEVRDMTLRVPIRAKSVIDASVMPSEKYSCAGSPERFVRGSAAWEWMGGTPLGPAIPRSIHYAFMRAVRPAKWICALRPCPRYRLAWWAWIVRGFYIQ